ncbi:MAG TPA: dTDP-4-dehydrorhamnose 3,5-epimerase, partial [Kofleriaceae bacterium]|nr:dTDP-4-dehydrorhamnose 3,5-epimerase [Kofleriaceae bacterium]
RGMHFQIGDGASKLVRCARGRIWDVLVDIRRGSPTFAQWFGTELSADNHHQMWIPPGFAHGFVATSESAMVCYKVTANYAPADERAIAWNDPQLAIRWPLAGTPTVSGRDGKAPQLADAELPQFRS